MNNMNNMYEFIKTDYNKLVGRKMSFEASIIAMKAEDSVYRNDNVNQDEFTKEYAEAKNMYYDATMSCNKKECLAQLKYFMSNAIAYGIYTQNLDWKSKFLAAYDIFNDISYNTHSQAY